MSGSARLSSWPGSFPPTSAGAPRGSCLPKGRGRFIAGQARLRQSLARYVAPPPKALTFGYGAPGKPVLSLAVPGPFFSLGHSGGVAALGIAQGCGIGIDIERIRAIDGGVAKRFFFGVEIAALPQLHREDWRRGFYRCWTRKQAVIKAIGTALALGLAFLDISLATGPTACVLRLGGCHAAALQWSLADLAVGPDMNGAIGARTQGAGLRHPLPSAAPERLGSTG
jgi:4'-phosphopantetheinyl transferase